MSSALANPRAPQPSRCERRRLRPPGIAAAPSCEPKTQHQAEAPRDSQDTRAPSKILPPPMMTVSDVIVRPLPFPFPPLRSSDSQMAQQWLVVSGSVAWIVTSSKTAEEKETKLQAGMSSPHAVTPERGCASV